MEKPGQTNQRRNPIDWKMVQQGLIDFTQAFLVYFPVSLFSLLLLYKPGFLPVFCIANGWGLTALLRRSRRRWPPYLLGAVLGVGLTYPLLFQQNLLGVAVGLLSVFEVCLAAILLQRFTSPPISFDDFSQAFRYIALAPLLSCGVSALLGMLILFGSLGEASTTAMITMWGSDAVGMLTITPMVFVLTQDSFWIKKLSRPRKIEGLILLVVFSLFSGLTYLTLPENILGWMQEYMVFLFLVWAAIDFGPGGATLVITLLSLILIPTTVRNLGVFTLENPDYLSRLISVQAFLAISSITSLLIASLISEREKKTHQLTLQASALKAAANGIMITDRFGVVQVINAAFSKLTGYSEEDVLGRSLAGLNSAANSPEIAQQIQMNVQAGLPWVGEALSYRKDGSSYYEDMSITPVVDPKGMVEYIIAVTQDITTRKENERYLRESEELFRAIFEGCGLGISITNSQEEFLRFNQAFLEMLGYAPGELTEINYRNITHPDDIQAYKEQCEKLLRGQSEIIQVEKRYIRKDGRAIWVRLNTTLIRDSRRGPLYVGMAEDITKHRQADSNLKWQLDQNLRLLAETHRRSRELEAISEISTALRKAYSRQEMLPILLEQTMQAMQADTAALILLQEKELVYMAEAGVAEGLHGVRYEYGRDPIWEVLQGTEPLFITGGNNPLLKSWHFARLAMGEMQAGIFAPLRSSSVNVGLLFLGYSRQPELFQELTNLVVAISEIAGNALYRTETMETLERMVAERSKDLQTIYEVSTLANQEQDLDTTLARSLDHVLAAMHCRSGSIHLVDEVDEVLELVVARNTDPRLLPYIERIPFNEGLQGWVVSNGKSIMVPDISADSRAIRRDPIEDYNTYLGVPLRVGGKVLGVISVRREGDYPFNIDEIALLGSIADHVGISVENAYLTERSEEAAVIEERSRLARELHDSVTQSIYGVTLFAEAARQQMAAQEPPGSGGLPDQVNSLISRVRDVALQALKEMRLLVYELRPPALEQDGLVGGIQQRLDAVEGRVGIHTRLVYEQKPVMSIEQEEALYRITIEALNNILKHAHASEVVVRIETHDKCVSLEISDNGEGFDPGEIQSMGGLGLIGIRERVVRMGGELAIESEIGKGTCIRVNTPIQMSAGRRLRRQMKA